MSLKVGALALFIVVVALALTAVIMLVRSMFTATKGKKIANYPEPRKALVVLDLQEAYAGDCARPPVTNSSASGFFHTVNRLIDKAAESGVEVAYIRQVFGNNFMVRLHGGKRQGKVVIDRRVKLINGNDFEKNRTDAFSNRQFEQFLIDRQVGELYLLGVDAAYCVYYTALGALNRGYRVTVITDAVLSRKSMTEVLERYRRKGITFITSEQLTGSS